MVRRSKERELPSVKAGKFGMITSVHNTKVQRVRALQARQRRRRQEAAFVVEGVRLVEEALQAGWPAQLVCYTAGLDERRQHLVDAFIAAGVETEQVSDSVMQAMSDTKTPQGVLAVLGVVDIPFPESLSFVLILDGVRDPGNLGAILRSAAASGVDGVILTPGSVEIYSPKVLRAAMGAHFRMPVQQFDWEGIKRMLHTAGLRTFMAEVGGGTRYDQVDFNMPLALVIGSEAAGASPALQELADERIFIPMVRAVESLNAANAAAVLLFEVVRQRTT